MLAKVWAESSRITASMAKFLEPRHESRSLRSERRNGKTLGSNLANDSAQTVPKIFCLESLNGVDVSEITISRLQQHLSDCDFTSLELVDSCFQRVRNVRLSLLDHQFIIHLDCRCQHFARSIRTLNQLLNSTRTLCIPRTF